MQHAPPPSCFVLTRFAQAETITVTVRSHAALLAAQLCVQAVALPAAQLCVQAVALPLFAFGSPVFSRLPPTLLQRLRAHDSRLLRR